MHSSYASLGRDFKSTFDDLVKHLNEQQAEVNQLRQQIVQADMALLAANSTAQNKLTQVINEEKLKAAEERQHLLTQITSLVNSTAEAQESRMTSKIIGVSEGIDSAHAAYNTVHDAYNQGMDNWSKKSKELVSGVVSSRDSVKTKIKADFAVSFPTCPFRPQLIFLF